MEELDSVLEQELDIFDGPEEVVEPTEPAIEKPIQPEINDEDDIFDEPEEQPKDDLVTDLLKARGIKGTKLTMLNEDEEEVEVDFFELPREEQIELLNASEEVSEKPAEGGNLPEGLSDNEQDFIKYLRDNDLSLDDYLQKYKENAVSEAGVEPEVSYDIDAYSDEELFLLDLKSRYEDLTDEELKKELDTALEDEELFKKKIGKTREEYKALEERYKEEQDQAELQQKEEQYGQFIDTMVDVAVKNPEFHGIELEDDEKNEVLSYLLELNDQGTSEFSRALNDPIKLYEAAWFLKYGKEAFDAIRDAYESEIKQLKKDAPPKVDKKEEKKPEVVVKEDPKKDDGYISLYDLGL